MKKGLGLLVLAVSIVFMGNIAFAQDGYKIVPLPDTIAQKTPIDTAVYNNTAEFFTPYIVNELNQTQFLSAPTITDVKKKIQSDYWLNKSTVKAMDEFRKFYKLDFDFTKKIAKLYDTNYVLLITSATDSTNYITRRTWWDFFNIAGASVLDPAYKINIYAVLIDTDKDLIVWNKSYQKTISVVENRIVATGYAPQTEQLQKIKDYSVYLAPRVARSIQDTLLTPTQKAVESNLIHTDYGSIDNVFTKKYRGLRQEVIDASITPAAKARDGFEVAKEKYNTSKEKIKTKTEKQKQKKTNGIEPIEFIKKEDVQTEIPAVQIQKVTPDTVEEIPTKAVENTSETTKELTKDAQTKVPEIIEDTPSIENKPEANEVTKQDVEVTKNTPAETTPKTEVSTTELKTTTTEAIPVVATPVSNEEVKPVPKEKQLAPTPISSEETAPQTEQKQKELKIDKDIDKRTQELLKKAFKNKPIDSTEQPTDSLIYQQPSDYLPTNYIPQKPRLREIHTDDTYNTF